MDQRFDDIAAYLTQKTGIVLSTTQRAQLEQHVAKRLSSTDLRHSIVWLSDPVEFRLLVDCLTVPETFFYRYEAQFDAFRDHLLPCFLGKARAEGRSVRIWSAGCCTGEEAYTLALIASEMHCLDAVEILATDINEGYLEAAMAGVFSKRSVEKLPPSILQKYFSIRADRFVLDNRVKEHVTFKWLNLAEPCYPSFLNQTTGIDMIWCRNVLIYFARDNVREIISRFADCLGPEGMLALGHSEMLPRDWRLTVGQVGDAFFYRQPATAPRPSVVAPAPVVRVAQSRTVVRPRPAVPTAAPPPIITKPIEDVQTRLERAESLANAGRSDDARKVCLEVIGTDPTLERGHYLLGLLTLDRPAEAREHFRKAVYLDPDHLPARLHLAECMEKLGHTAEAVREYRNLERIARGRAPDDVLDAREGITFGMLALMGRQALERHGEGR